MAAGRFDLEHVALVDVVVEKARRQPRRRVGFVERRLDPFDRHPVAPAARCIGQRIAPRHRLGRAAYDLIGDVELKGEKLAGLEIGQWPAVFGLQVKRTDLAVGRFGFALGDAKGPLALPRPALAAGLERGFQIVENRFAGGRNLKTTEALFHEPQIAPALDQHHERDDRDLHQGPQHDVQKQLKRGHSDVSVQALPLGRI